MAAVAAIRANRAQNKDSLLGKILRIDVNGTLGSRQYLIPHVEPVRRQGRPERDLVVRPAQPVAVLVRPGPRRHLGRRRRAVRLRGGQPQDGDLEGRPQRSRLQLRLARAGGQPLLPSVVGLQQDAPRSCRSPSTPTPTAAARSRAAMSTAGRCPRSSPGATCSATSAAAPSGRSPATPPSGPSGWSSSRRTC